MEKIPPLGRTEENSRKPKPKPRPDRRNRKALSTKLPRPGTLGIHGTSRCASEIFARLASRLKTGRDDADLEKSTHQDLRENAVARHATRPDRNVRPSSTRLLLETVESSPHAGLESARSLLPSKCPSLSIRRFSAPSLLPTCRTIQPSTRIDPRDRYPRARHALR